MPDDRPLGLRERKKLETRQALAEAAIRLAIEQGFENVTVEAIAVRAGVSARTFFNYFPSKEDAVLRPDDDPIQQTRQLVAAFEAIPLGVAPVRALARAFRPMAERIDREAEEWRVRISVIEQDPALVARMFTAREETERLVIDAIAARLNLDPGADFYPALLFQMVGAGFHAATKRWYRLGGDESVTTFFDEAIDALVAGLPAPD
jgi:AcrR family transcriptional regulator